MKRRATSFMLLATSTSVSNALPTFSSIPRTISLKPFRMISTATTSRSHALRNGIIGTNLDHRSSNHHYHEHGGASSPFSSSLHAEANTSTNSVPITPLAKDIPTSQQSPSEVKMTEHALSITQAAIQAVDPIKSIEQHLHYDPSDSTITLQSNNQSNLIYKLNQSTYDSIIICAFGKAATSMALKTAQIVSQAKIKIKGIVITKYDHATQNEIDELKKYNIDLHFASHPIPDEQSVETSQLLLDMIRNNKNDKESKNKTLVLNCISGGGSALFCTPRHPLTLQHMANVNAQLLACGMPITEMNIIRKKLEIGKGGGLVGLAYPSTSITLVLSDVIGDPLDLIASGPSVVDESTWDDAWDLVERYGLNIGQVYELPSVVLDILKDGKDGKLDQLDDLPTLNHPVFCEECAYSPSQSKLSETVLVGNNAQAVSAAAKEAKNLGYNPVVLGTTIEGEALDIANMYVSMAHQIQKQRTDPSSAMYPMVKLPAALIAGGETTVTLSKNHGKGGRNQEIGLAAALKMKNDGLRDMVLCSIGTDGTDGPTDAAGAVVDGSTVGQVERNNGGNFKALDALEQHDAYNFLDGAMGNPKPLVKTGPTGTNVADVCVTLIQ